MNLHYIYFFLYTQYIYDIIQWQKASLSSAKCVEDVWKLSFMSHVYITFSQWYIVRLREKDEKVYLFVSVHDNNHPTFSSNLSASLRILLWPLPLRNWSFQLIKPCDRNRSVCVCGVIMAGPQTSEAFVLYNSFAFLYKTSSSSHKHSTLGIPGVPTAMR